MEKLNFISKQDGDLLNASEWNSLAGKVDEIIDEVENTQAVTWGSINDKGNLELTSTKHINLEPAYDESGSDEGTYGDIQLKPGDDITLESSHRADSKKDEITIKTTTGIKPKKSVKLQVIASDLTLSTKDKVAENNDSSNVMNINVTTGSGKGYLKVRAQAIDLRCEENGGIALLPKGDDSNGHENKIKFEHDGGDGKEFGTFNTLHSSLFTNDYRFNKDGIVYAVTRGELETIYKTPNDPESGIKKIDYPTQTDDFKDIIDENTPRCTWEDIVKFIAWAKANAVGSAWENLWPQNTNL